MFSNQSEIRLEIYIKIYFKNLMPREISQWIISYKTPRWADSIEKKLIWIADIIKTFLIKIQLQISIQFFPWRLFCFSFLSKWVFSPLWSNCISQEVLIYMRVFPTFLSFMRRISQIFRKPQISNRNGINN